jgi:hypothetical protein
MIHSTISELMKLNDTHHHQFINTLMVVCIIQFHQETDGGVCIIQFHQLTDGGVHHSISSTH